MNRRAGPGSAGRRRPLDDVAPIDGIRRRNGFAGERKLGLLDEARLYDRLRRQGLPQIEIAEKLGVDKRRVSEKLKLLELSAEVHALLRAGKLTEAHARALTGAPVAARAALVRQCLDEGWQAQELRVVARGGTPPPRNEAPAPAPSHVRFAGARYGTFEVARLAGVTWRTVYNWLREGRLPEPERDPRGQRIWTPEAVVAAIQLARNPQRRRNAQDRRTEPEGRDG